MANLARKAREAHPGATVAKRTRNSIHLDIGAGRRIAYIGGHNDYHLPDGQTEIDTAWVAENIDGFQWGKTLADYHARARSVFNAGDLVRLTHPESGHWVIFDPQSINWINQDNSRQQIAIKQSVTATVGTGIDDDLLTWSNAYGTGRHMTYRAAPGRLEKNIILDAPGVLPAATVTGTVHFEAEFALKHSAGLEFWLDGVLWAKTNGVRVKTANRIECKDAAGNVLFYLASPFATDSAGNEAATEYEVRRQGASYFYTVRVPKAWLDAAVFPVYIDPTLTQESGTADGYIYGGNATYATARSTSAGYASTGNSIYVGQYYTGTEYYIYRSYILFDTSSLSGYTVNQANLRLVMLVDNSSLDFDVQIVKQDWAAQNPLSAGNREAAYDNCLGGTADNSIWSNTSSISTNTQYTSGNLDTNWINTSGTTYYSLRSHKDYGSTAPTTTEYITLATTSHPTTSYRPTLIVDYSEPSSGIASDIFGLSGIFGGSIVR